MTALSTRTKNQTTPRTPEALLRAGMLAEESMARLLGGVLYGAAYPGHSACVRALATLPPDLHLGDMVARITGAALAVLEDGEALSMEAVTRRLLKSGQYQEGDAVYMAECTGKATTNAPACAADVWELAREAEREVLRAGIRVRMLAGEPFEELTDRLSELDLASGTGARVPDAVCTAPEPPPPVFGYGPLPETFCILTGDSAAGKTWAALTLAVSVATGRALWPSMAPTEKRPVVMATYEDGPQLINARLRAIAATFGVPFDEIEAAEGAGMLSVFCTPEQPLLVADAAGRPQPTSAWRQIKRHVLAVRPALAILDPLSASMVYPENSNDAAAVVAAHLRNLGKRSGAAVLLTAHTSKSGAGNDGQHAMRGASSMTGACRWHARLVKEGDAGTMRLTVAKNSAGPRPLPLLLEQTPSGPLRETGRAQMDPQVVELAVIDFFKRNPEATVSPGGVLTKRGEAARLVSDVLAAIPSAKPNDVHHAVQNLIETGQLGTRTDKKQNRHTRDVLALLEPVYYEGDADDVPF